MMADHLAIMKSSFFSLNDLIVAIMCYRLARRRAVYPLRNGSDTFIRTLKFAIHPVYVPRLEILIDVFVLLANALDVVSMCSPLTVP